MMPPCHIIQEQIRTIKKARRRLGSEGYWDSGRKVIIQARRTNATPRLEESKSEKGHKNGKSSRIGRCSVACFSDPDANCDCLDCFLVQGAPARNGVTGKSAAAGIRTSSTIEGTGTRNRENESARSWKAGLNIRGPERIPGRHLNSSAESEI